MIDKTQAEFEIGAMISSLHTQEEVNFWDFEGDVDRYIAIIVVLIEDVWPERLADLGVTCAELENIVVAHVRQPCC